MTKICIYDSGIGGLTTLCELAKAHFCCDVLYYADNANHPFGNKSKEQIQLIVKRRIETLQDRCDIIVLACNTASTTIDDDNVFKLIPPLDEISKQERAKTLVLATPRTIDNLKRQNPIAKDFLFADTSELANIVEKTQIAIHSNDDSNKTECKTAVEHLQKYIKNQLEGYGQIHNVIVGCSHYQYCKKEIESVMTNVKFFDGNSHLCKQLNTVVNCDDACEIDNVQFEFSGQNLTKIYREIYADYLRSQKSI